MGKLGIEKATPKAIKGKSGGGELRVCLSYLSPADSGSVGDAVLSGPVCIPNVNNIAWSTVYDEAGREGGWG